MSENDPAAEWAVCPSIDRSVYRDGWVLPAKHFRTEAEAKAWLADDHEFRPSGYRGHCSILRVSRRCAYAASNDQIDSFSEWLALDRVPAGLPKDNLILRLQDRLEGLIPEFTCSLGADWEFERIASDAKHRRGHIFPGRTASGYPERVIRALHDLDAALRAAHPALSAAAVADFWNSYEVASHLAWVCYRVTKAFAPDFPADLADTLEPCRLYALRKMHCYAKRIRESQRPKRKRKAVREADTTGRGSRDRRLAALAEALRAQIVAPPED